MIALYSVGKNAIRRGFDVIGKELLIIVKWGYNGSYYFLDSVGKYQNSFFKEQLECLEEVAADCTAEEKSFCQS